MGLHELLEELGVQLRVVAFVEGELVRGPDGEEALDELDDALLLLDVQIGVILRAQALQALPAAQTTGPAFARRGGAKAGPHRSTASRGRTCRGARRKIDRYKPASN